MSEQSPMQAALSAAVTARPFAAFSSGDPTEALPPAARQKLERAVADRDAAHAAYLATSDSWREVWTEHGRALAFARSRLDLPAGLGPDAHPAAVALADVAARRNRTEAEQRLLAPVDAAAARLTAAADARDRAAERQAAFAYVENVVSWLARTARPGVVFVEAPAPAIGKIRGDIRAAIAQTRDELSAVDAEFAAAEAAPLPADELRHRAIAEIDRVAKAGALTLNPRNRSGDPLGLTRRLSLSATTGASGATHILGDAGAPVLVWLIRDLLVGEVELQIEATDFTGALTDAERDDRFAELAARRLEIERREEALVELAEAEGRIVQRRPDLDPRAFLGVIA